MIGYIFPKQEALHNSLQSVSVISVYLCRIVSSIFMKTIQFLGSDVQQSSKFHLATKKSHFKSQASLFLIIHFWCFLCYQSCLCSDLSAGAVQSGRLKAKTPQVTIQAEWSTICLLFLVSLVKLSSSYALSGLVGPKLLSPLSVPLRL